MTLTEKEEKIIEDFSVFDDWLDKYEYIIELGKELPKINNDYKVDDNLISGCQSRVWLYAEKENNSIKFHADSDAIITKGIIALLINVVNNELPETIASTKFSFIKKIGLQEHLSPTRANGLVSMIEKIKLHAIKFVK